MRITSNLAQRLILYIMLFSATATIALSTFQLMSDYRREVGSIEERLDEIGLTQYQSIAKNLWALDFEGLELQIAGLILIPDIQHAVIHDPEGNVVITQGEDPGERTPMRTFPLSYSFGGEDFQLGQLTVKATLDNVYQRTRSRALSVFLTQALLIFLISAFILFIVHRLVTQPLNWLARHARAATVETFDTPLDAPTLDGRQDEIGALYHALNDMRDNVHHQLERRNDLREAAGRGLASVGTAISCRRLSTAGGPSPEDVVVGQEVPPALTDLITLQTSDSEFAAALEQRGISYRRIPAPIASMGIDPQRVDLRLAYEVFLEGGASWLVTSVIIDNAIQTEIFVETTETNQIQNELLQAQKSDALGRLTGGVAHDFNNILAVALGSAEILELSLEEPELRRHVEAIIKACQSGSKLTSSLLSFARAAHLEARQIDVNDIVSSMMSWSRRTLPASIVIDVVLHAGLWKIWADPSMTENALLNIVLNARDAMPDGGKLTVETANCRIDEEYVTSHDKTLAPGRYVMMAVTDTGHGIPKEILQKIFDPFFTTKARGSGSGIGLSAVQGFLKQSGGTVRVYSEPGIGTTFKLFFPAMTSEAQAGSPETRSEVKPTKGAQVLLVEDEPELCRIMAEHLGTAGYDVTATATGEDALTIAATMPTIDVVLTDIVLSGPMNGLAMIREMRKSRSDMQVIYMSGYAQEATVHGNGLRPEDVRLTKPVDRHTLLRAIEMALGSREGAG